VLGAQMLATISGSA
jgi:hypothetical protein